eukprot:TRINITY_DN12160_c0_g1_i2.p1 TRINITY_DN12160_c0_g1~~TRINITY_DN12160_c0_g1_i2.p1  ORF type:complete len:346 (+),score=97.25 TRINITY_DN12160_c0_g1_i2:110-1147(+)
MSEDKQESNNNNNNNGEDIKEDNAEIEFEENDEYKDLSSDELKNLGNDQYRKKNYDEAIKFYTYAIRKQPSAPLYSNRSACYFFSKRYDKALEDANNTIKLDENYSKGYSRKGMVLARTENFLEAIETLEICEKLQKKNGENISNTQKELESARFRQRYIKEEPILDTIKHKKRLNKIQKTVKTNVELFQTVKFATAVTSMSMPTKNCWKLMTPAIVDKAGKIVSLDGYLSCLKNKLHLDEVNRGERFLIYVTVMIGKPKSVKEHFIEFTFRPWDGDNTSQFFSPLPPTQEVVDILNVSMLEINRVSSFISSSSSSLKSSFNCKSINYKVRNNIFDCLHREKKMN